MTKVKKISLAAAALVVMVSYQNCADMLGSSSHDKASVQRSNANYNLIVGQAYSILSQNCAGCHNPSSSSRGPISDILNETELISGGFVVIGSPQTSPLYLAIVDGVEPRDGDPISAADAGVLRNWILGPELYVDDIPIGGGGGGGGTLTPATFANVNSMIIQPMCIRCHGPGDARGDLSTYAAVMIYVVPGSTASGSFWGEVAANTMPQGGPPLSGTLKSLLSRWIQAGALNN